MDDDATVGSPLEDVVRSDDKLIIGRLINLFSDFCYADSHPCSQASYERRFGKYNLKFLYTVGILFHMERCIR